MRTAWFLALTLSAGSALAQDGRGDALVVNNAARGNAETAQAFRDAGFEVTSAERAGASGLRNGLSVFLDRLAPEDGPVVVALEGDFMSAGGGVFLLPETGRTVRSAAEALTDSLSVPTILSALAAYPGEAFLLLGDSGAAEGIDPWLRSGTDGLMVPQGVTLLSGAPEDVRDFAQGALLEEGTDVASAARDAGLSVSGYAPAGLRLWDQGDMGREAGMSDPAADDAAWDLARTIDDASSYRLYLNGFPEGRYASEARQRMSAIADEPAYAARQTEEALNLTREARQKIQRDLSILGYDTRGIDGIFGQGTRGAITQWQGEAGFEQSSYLNASQIAALGEAAQERAAELEEEARIAAQERREQERDLWREVSGPEDEGALRAYLDAFPEGENAQQARDWLNDIEAERGQQAEDRDRERWDEAREQDSITAYRDYLDAQPEGAFVEQAQARIDELNTAARNEDAAREEERLGLNTFTRRLAETRLQQLGLDPGAIDGTFDSQTRTALRTFQRDRGLEATGYLNQTTVVRLLADGLLSQ